MNTAQINNALSVGAAEGPGIFPRLELLKEARFVFRFDFGLDALPEEPGIILVRGPRQYGKSTWLEQQILATVKRFGPGSMTRAWIESSCSPGACSLPPLAAW